jgi:hypothetical protein
MAKLKPLNEITEMYDMQDYIRAEAAVAAEKCPGAYNAYQDAARILEANSRYAGTSLQSTYVQMAREAVLKARQTWYAIGCPDPKVVSPEPASSKSTSTTKTTTASMTSGEGFGNIAKFLLAGGALFVIMMVFAKEPKKAKRKTPAKRRRTTGRRVVRRRTTTYYR